MSMFSQITEFWFCIVCKVSVNLLSPTKRRRRRWRWWRRRRGQRSLEAEAGRRGWWWRRWWRWRRDVDDVVGEYGRRRIDEGGGGIEESSSVYCVDNGNGPWLRTWSNIVFTRKRDEGREGWRRGARRSQISVIQQPWQSFFFFCCCSSFFFCCCCGNMTILHHHIISYQKREGRVKKQKLSETWNNKSNLKFQITSLT